MKKSKRNLLFGAILLLMLFALLFGALFFREKYVAWIILSFTILSVLPMFFMFERREKNAGELSILAVLIALSVAGRMLFAWLPGFKPVAALTVIAALYLGKEAGFLVGSLSAVLSNFYFGQGPWTPFQMFSWGMIGLAAGLLARPLKKSKLLLGGFAILAGIFYSLSMDVWTVIWAEGGFSLSRYLAVAVSSLPVMVEYILSNLVFLLLLAKPIGEKLDRVRIKYGLFLKKEDLSEKEPKEKSKVDGK